MLAPPVGSWCPLLGEILDPPLQPSKHISGGWAQRGVEGTWRGTEESRGRLFILCYHCLPLATINLVGDNRGFEV